MHALILANTMLFLSTLSLRRATCSSPLMWPWSPLFLSTLSLRRATMAAAQVLRPPVNFYPRSPCGERHQAGNVVDTPVCISIHALLAESDHIHSTSHGRPGISIHALLAESDPGANSMTPDKYYFYPRSPCGERQKVPQILGLASDISIHALLAESDPRSWRLRPKTRYFYPRSPCGERP